MYFVFKAERRILSRLVSMQVSRNDNDRAWGSRGDDRRYADGLKLYPGQSESPMPWQPSLPLSRRRALSDGLERPLQVATPKTSANRERRNAVLLCVSARTVAMPANEQPVGVPLAGSVTKNAGRGSVSG